MIFKQPRIKLNQAVRNIRLIYFYFDNTVYRELGLYKQDKAYSHHHHTCNESID